MTEQFFREDMQQAPELSMWSEVAGGSRGMQNEGVKTVSVAYGQRKVTPPWSQYSNEIVALPENPVFLTLLHGELAETDVLTEKCLINYSLEMLLTKSMLAVVLVHCLPICLLL